MHINNNKTRAVYNNVETIIPRDCWMSITLTPKLMQATYEFLRAIPPFGRWNLPHGEEVVFLVSRSRKAYGEHFLENNTHKIRMSTHGIQRTFSLIETMAHEMIHVKCDNEGIKSEHGTAFHKHADQVCKYHGFDRGTF